MDYLARREHSAFELKQKLTRKYPDAEIELVDAVLGKLQQQKLQSDARFTEAYIRYRKSRGFGYLHLKADLDRRGVAVAVIDEYLYEDDTDWLQIIDSLVTKKMPNEVKIEFASKQHKKILRFLQARGFSALEASRVLSEKLLNKWGQRNK